MNSWLYLSIDPTRFYTAADAADFMSVLTILYFPLHHILHLKCYSHGEFLHTHIFSFPTCHGGLGVLFLHVSSLPLGSDIDHVR